MNRRGGRTVKIEIDSGAKEWIALKGNELTVKTMEVRACCAPGVQDLVAVPGKPKKITSFHEFIIDDVSIYVQKSIRGKEKLTLKLSGFSLLKSISAKLQ